MGTMTECEAIGEGLAIIKAEALKLPASVPMVGAPMGRLDIAPDPRWVAAQEEAEAEQEMELYADWDS
jgi:hypothetical protein